MHGTRARVKSTGHPEQQASNIILVQCVDGSTGTFTLDLKNGSQAFDETYTVSSPTRAPNIGLSIYGVARDAKLAGFTNHAGSWGTYFNVRTVNCRWALFARARATHVDNCVFTGRGDGIGLYFGEDGYWTDSVVTGGSASNFGQGLLTTGFDNTLGRRALNISGFSSYDNDVLYDFGNSSGGDDADGDVMDMSCVNMHGTATDRTQVGLVMRGGNDGISFSGTLRGPFIEAPIRVERGILDKANINVRIIDGGAVPAITSPTTDAGSFGKRTKLDIDRDGIVMPPSVDTAICATTPCIAGTVKNTSTISTVAYQTWTAEAARIAAGELYDGSRINVVEVGEVTGTSASKISRLRFGTTNVSQIPIPDTYEGPYRITRHIDMTSESQADILTVVDLNGLPPQVSEITVSGLSTLTEVPINIQARVNDVTSSISPKSVYVETITR